ncbi:Protein naked cuticle -like protein 2 [Channa argus]|uniref:Protein naked cuticle homolog n=1 Tax=Channa argus TaxID=215402 RepID=A0A6G1QY45_CHAAH|nr:Protein naked cuticle -like protein 2 [Channa argus]
MGKFQSRHALKGRQSPEGGSLGFNVVTCHRLEPIHRHKSKVTENLCVELRENGSDHNCNHNVVVPPKKTPDTDKSTYIQVNKQKKKKKKHAAVSVTECCMGPEEYSRQEWVFTLYNFDNRGKVAKEDMSRLIHSMYEALEASMKQPYAGLKALKVKLEVTATASPDKISQTSTEREKSTSQKVGSKARKLYCVDENIERRNHYLDLAGIENYNSKFDNTEPPSQEPRHLAHSAFQHHTVVATKNCMAPECPKNSILYSLSSKSTSVRNDRSRRDGKTCKHPASWCHLTKSHPPAHTVLHGSRSKRLRSRVQDAASHIKPTPRKDREVFSGVQLSCTVPLVQRHEHNHYHEHHHHHHYHLS